MQPTSLSAAPALTLAADALLRSAGERSGHGRRQLSAAQLDAIVRETLIEFADEILDGRWAGRREREAVSYFAFRHLVPRCTRGGFLYHPAQIAIEVAVPQLDGHTIKRLTKRPTAKAQVCKDLIIWPTPGMTCWDEARQPTIHPASILEWKFGGRTLFEYDMRWLEAYSADHPSFVGYAIQIDPLRRDFTAAAARIRRGSIDEGWLRA